jgi:hypothetical protein
MKMAEQGTFRSQTVACVVCGWRTTYRIQLANGQKRFARNYRRLVEPLECPKRRDLIIFAPFLIHDPKDDIEKWLGCAVSFPVKETIQK